MKYSIIVFLFVFYSFSFSETICRIESAQLPKFEVIKKDDSKAVNSTAIVETLKTKDIRKRTVLKDVFGVEEFTRIDCYKEEFKLEAVQLEKGNYYNVLYYRNITDRSGKGKAVFLFFRKYGKDEEYISKLELSEWGAQVSDDRETFKYKWDGLISEDGVKELVLIDKYGGHAASEKRIFIFKIIKQELKIIFSDGLGGNMRVDASNYDSYENDIEFKTASFPRVIIMSGFSTTGSTGKKTKTEVEFRWSKDKNEYVKYKSTAK